MYAGKRKCKLHEHETKLEGTSGYLGDEAGWNLYHTSGDSENSLENAMAHGHHRLSSYADILCNSLLVHLDVRDPKMVTDGFWLWTSVSFWESNQTYASQIVRPWLAWAGVDLPHLSFAVPVWILLPSLPWMTGTAHSNLVSSVLTLDTTEEMTHFTTNSCIKL